MGSLADGPPAHKAEAAGVQPRTGRGRPLFIKLTGDMNGIPVPRRGSAPVGDQLTPREQKVLNAILLLGGLYRPCRASDVEIAEACGFPGTKATLKKEVQNILHGRVRNGARSPGLTDPSRGWITIHDDETSPTRRAVEVNPKYLEWSRIRVHRDPGDPPSHEPPDDALPGAVVAGAFPMTPAAAEPAIAEAPSAEVLVEVLGPYYALAGRDAQAGHVLQELTNQSWGLELLPDGKIRPLPPARAVDDPRPEDLSPATKEVLRWLKPELVALLEDRARAKAAPAAAGVKAPAAPRVPADLQRRITALIGRLEGHPDPSVDAEYRDLLMAAFPADAEPETSFDAYAGHAHSLRTRAPGWAPDLLIAAFEAACKAKTPNRGRVYTGMIQAGLAGRLSGGR